TYSVTVKDVTGCPATGSAQVGVNVGIETVAASEIHLFPNPMHEGAVIQMPQAGSYFIEIANVSGEKIYADHFSGNQYWLKRNNLPQGVYYVSIGKDGEEAVRKIMVVE